MNTMTFAVPGIPPSSNSYVRHTRTGRHYITAEARRFEQTVELIAKCVRNEASYRDAYALSEAKRVRLEISVYLGKGQRRDWDNCPKLIGDALQNACVIRNDAVIAEGEVKKFRDWANPRTEIVLKVIA